MAWLDSAIAAVSPSWAAQRERSRMELERARLGTSRLRGFNAASGSRRLADWNAFTDTKATDPAQHLKTIRQRSRDMRRNNPYWNAAIMAIVGETVGGGVRAKLKHRQGNRTTRVQEDWDAWANSEQVDALGEMDFYQIQALALEGLVESGEVLIRRILRRDGLHLLVLTADHLAASRDGAVEGGGEIIGGVEVDSDGRRVAYHLHPKVGSTEVVRVDASEIIHMYRRERPGQLRGIPWVAPVFTRLAHWDDYEDAELARQKVAACMATFVIGEDPPEGDDDLPESVEPGQIAYLSPGSDVKHTSPPPSSGLDTFAKITLRGVATGVGITYELLTQDYSQVNFSSARMSRIAMHRKVKRWQREIVIGQLCRQVFAWWQAAEGLRTSSTNARGAVATWVAPAIEMVDPDKETKADNQRIRSGLASWKEVMRERGRDPERVAEEIREGNELWDELGLVLDCDPRKLSQAGQGTENTGTGGESNGSEDDDEDAAA